MENIKQLILGTLLNDKIQHFLAQNQYVFKMEKSGLSEFLKPNLPIINAVSWHPCILFPLLLLGHFLGSAEHQVALNIR